MGEEVLRQIDAYYTDKVRKYGTTVQGVDWNSHEAQRLRFVQLTKIISENTSGGFSICDYGCGLGDYYHYLSEKFLTYDYYGVDVSKEMVGLAQSKYPKASFYIGSQLTQDFDYIVASGIFNVKQAFTNVQWTKYILETLDMFNQYARKGFAFNCLTKYSDYDHQKDYLYYADPLMIFDYCKRNFSKNVALLHDYTLYDFTILVRKG